MVKEVDILFRIQKLQQGRGWVTLVTTTYLIHLAKRGMEKKKRIPAKKGSNANEDTNIKVNPAGIKACTPLFRR